MRVLRNRKDFRFSSKDKSSEIRRCFTKKKVSLETGRVASKRKDTKYLGFSSMTKEAELSSSEISEYRGR